jgi:hypothetical protein
MPPLPPIPQPATVPPGAETFGTAAKVGVSVDYARADHVHAMPIDPVPAHNVAQDAHRNLRLGHVVPPPSATSSDVRGTTENNLVVGVQGIPVAPPQPNEGNTLVVRSGILTWEAKTVGPVGEFVEHPADAGRYLIVAAGRFDQSGKPIPPNLTYNNLTATQLQNLPGVFRLDFGLGNPANPIQGYVTPEPPGQPPSSFMYMVKGTVVGRLQGTFQVLKFNKNGITVQVLNLQGQSEFEGFMIEISLYGKF